MSRIAPDHLGRQAIVYVRQSTQDQLLHNHESRRRQYGLADRARQLGWAEPVVIDDDLGRSGGGVARPGFERLLLAIRRASSTSTPTGVAAIMPSAFSTASAALSRSMPIPATTG